MTVSGYDRDKYYVGITHKDTSVRWGKNGIGYKGQAFYSAIEKYGWDNIIHEVLACDLTFDEACRMEIEAIDKYNSCDSRDGYNLSSGGYIGGFPSKRIAKYDLDGNLICVYKNRTIAQEEIEATIKVGEGINSHGFQWVWVENGEDPKDKISKYIDPDIKIYAQYDMDGNYIKSYHGKNEVKEDLNIDNFAPYYGSCAGYQWLILKYDEVPPIKIPRYENNLMKEIEKYDIYGNFIKSYRSGIEANKEHPTVNITQACSKERIFIDGFQWKYKDSDKVIKDLSHDSNYMKIYLYEKDGTFIGEFESKRQALLYIGNSGNCKIDENVFKLDYYNYRYGYRWSLNKVDKLPELIKYDSRSKPVVMISKETGNVIDIFTSCRDASFYLKSIGINLDENQIARRCSKNPKRNVDKEAYSWRYLKDINESIIIDSFLLDKYNKINTIIKLLKEE